MNTDLDPAVFAQPAGLWRGVTLWMLNDRLDRTELRRQLGEIRAAGIHTVITRTFVGLQTPYLGDEWMKVLEAVVSGARELGMRVWFQAGYMPGGIPDWPDEHCHTVLAARPRGEACAAGERVLLQDDAFMYVERRLPHVLDVLDPDAVRAYLRVAYEETWLRRFGSEFGRTIEAIWVDEPSFRPPLLPWGARIRERFSDQWRASLDDLIPLLFRRTGDYLYARHRYRRTALDALLSGYFAEVSAWCRAHGVLFTGHLMGEDTLASQVAWTGAAMPAYPFMDVPGIDHLTRSLHWRHGAQGTAEPTRFIATPKQCASAAGQCGRKRVLAEMYGVSTQGLSFADRKRIGEWFGALGITCRCLHGTFYSMRGRRKRIYAPHLSYQQPWWPDNRFIADSFARLGYALSRGEHAAEILVIHPVESAYAVFDPDDFAEGAAKKRNIELDALWRSFSQLGEDLLRIQRCFDYGDEQLLAERAAVAGGAITVGPMAYRVAIMPDLLTLRRTSVDLLNAFIDAGGTVLSTDRLPTRIDGMENADIERLTSRARRIEATPQGLRAVLDEVLPPRVRIDAARAAQHVVLHERVAADRRMAFLVNMSETDSVATTLHLRGATIVEDWDAATGATRPAPARSDAHGAVLPLELAPGQSRLLVFAENAPGAPAARTCAPEQRVTLDGPWHVRRLTPNALTLDICRVRRGDGDWSQPMPVIGAQQMLCEDEPYTGPVTLAFDFRVTDVPARLAVAVEDAGECAVSINGAAVSSTGEAYFLDRSFLPVELTPHVTAGDNTITVTRMFTPLAKPAFGLAHLFQNLGGTELEAVYLVGDFAVRAAMSPREQRARCVRLAPRFTLVRETGRTCGNLVLEGYPFFAGRLVLSTSFTFAPQAGARCILALPGLDASVARLRVNGRDAGHIAWPPYEADITDAVRAGNNMIEIELASSLRNLLGPHHRPAGEPDHAWGEEAFSGRWDRETRTGYDRWYLRHHAETTAWTSDYFVVPFGLPARASIGAMSR